MPYVVVYTDGLLNSRNVSIESMLSQLRNLSRQLGSMQVEDN